MKQNLDRVRNDLETIQKAMGLSPSTGRDWVQWMRRDNWLSLLWCLPGALLIASALLPIDNHRKFFGLVLAQWTGLSVAAVLLWVARLFMRRVTAKDGRPDSLVREYRRMNGLSAHGVWINGALFLQIALFFLWAKQYPVAFGAIWSGLFLLMGSSCLVVAIASKLWLLLGWAIPFLAYGLFEALLSRNGVATGIPLGVMFIAVALCFSAIQFLQLKRIERQHGSN